MFLKTPGVPAKLPFSVSFSMVNSRKTLGHRPVDPCLSRRMSNKFGKDTRPGDSADVPIADLSLQWKWSLLAIRFCICNWNLIPHRKSLAQPLCRNVRDFCCINLEDFAGDSLGGFFWAIFPQKWGQNNLATKFSTKKISGSSKKNQQKDQFCQNRAHTKGVMQPHAS